MAVKHVVTRGYGFADGTIYLPTRGYTPGAEAEPEPEPATTPGRRVAAVPRSARRQGTPPARHQGRTPRR